MAILFIENAYLFMKNFSAASYQTSSQVLTAKQSSLVSIKLGKNANSIWKKKSVP